LRKQKAALLSIISNSFLVILKVAAGAMTGSVGILSEALHSATDLIASMLAFYSIRKAERPADKDHPYGHGKYENLSGLIEGILIIVAALLIVYEAFKRMLSGETISLPFLALGVMGFSAVANLFISSYLMRIAKRTESIALEADAKHLRADVYSSAGVFIGLTLVVTTGYYNIDSITATGVSLLILYEGIVITRKSIHGLLDTSLPENELTVVQETLESLSNYIKDYHDLRTRKAGSERHIDLHLTVCSHERIGETHKTMDMIERKLNERLPGSKVIIHPEPCTHHNERCPAECYWLNIKEKAET
jgi:cation diffusion facilitator family transporter